MSKSLEKSAIKVTGMKEDGKSRTRTIENVVSNPDTNSLWKFGVLVGQLSGESTDEVQLIETSQISED